MLRRVWKNFTDNLREVCHDYGEIGAILNKFVATASTKLKQFGVYKRRLFVNSE